MHLIVGLGNPGDKYHNTRHNLGFEALELFRHKEALGEWQLEDKFKSEVVKQGDLIFARPQTFMNRSGLAVKKLADYYKIPAKNIIVLHDELDIVLGHIKIRLGGSDAGHHGVESVMNELGTDQFIRVRLGIGNLKALSGEHKSNSFQAEKYVLETFLPNESSKIKAMLKRTIKAIEVLISDGLEKAQNQYNDRGL